MSDTNLILTQTQAEHVYSAMCMLNNVGAFMGDVVCRDFELRVSRISGEISVRGKRLTEREHYANQLAFAAAYGLTVLDSNS